GENFLNEDNTKKIMSCYFYQLENSKTADEVILSQSHSFGKTIALIGVYLYEYGRTCQLVIGEFLNLGTNTKINYVVSAIFKTEDSVLCDKDYNHVVSEFLKNNKLPVCLSGFLFISALNYHKIS